MGAKRGFRRVDEFLSIFGFARRGGCYRIDLLGADLTGQRTETLERAKGADHAVLVEPAARCDAAPQAAQHLFVEDRSGGAPEAVIDDEAHRVGADIDNRYGTVFERAAA